jgi:hypothetical protein
MFVTSLIKIRQLVEKLLESESAYERDVNINLLSLV